ncbi:RNA-directed DNA polymerase from mobile element jockey-like [Brachionus plicatilis]|uniref:RNA-directed DNA polymerase from mobile element jockey-like n=1 Tax=Brachionus plicatilis TaxID=10195 RepID=A0A3M7RDF4_BRAPC|nr:RNA-directed DNA polymerase from mobile element jockey-like [Brachionus plicatilis]
MFKRMYAIWRIIKIGEEKSNPFRITEGVKQRGILSPYLFNFFIDQMLSECTDLKVGAKIGEINLSILAYCDDIVLLSPSEKHIKILLRTCEEYAKDWKIEFNASKSASMLFEKKSTGLKTDFKLNGSIIPKVQSLIYLGLPIGNQKSINDFLENKMKKVEKSFYSLNIVGCKPKLMKPETIAFFQSTKIGVN